MNITEDNSPVFITGAFRSGTTLITQILNNHPRLNLTFDTVNFMRFCFSKYNPINDIENVKKLISDLNNRISGRWNMQFNTDNVMSDISSTDISYRNIYNTVMNSLLLTNTDATIWGEKTTLVWTKIPDFFQMFPHGRVIHIYRDPRAVLASWKNMTHAPGLDYFDAVYNCIGSMQKAELYQKQFSGKRYQLLRFEDLVNESVKTVKEICNKFEIDYSPDLIDTSKFTARTGGSWKNNSMLDKNMSGISNSSIDLWKNKLEEWEIAFVQTLMPELLKRYNYELLPVAKIDYDKLITKIQSSNLLTNSTLRFLLTSKGVERFPTDPLNSKNWDKK